MYDWVLLQHCHSDSTLLQHFQVCLLVWCSERSKSARAPRHDKAQKERAQNALKHYQGAATPPVRTIAPSLPSCHQSARMADVPQKGSLPEAPRRVQSSQNPSRNEVSRLDSTQIIDPCQKRPSPTDAIHANSSQPSDPLDNPQAAKGAVLDAGILDPSNAYANSSDMATMAKFPLTEARSATSRLSKVADEHFAFGVKWDSIDRLWTAEVLDPAKRICKVFGAFATAQEAAHCYDRNALKLFGTLAVLNFPLADYKCLRNGSYIYLPGPADRPSLGGNSQRGGQESLGGEFATDAS